MPSGHIVALGTNALLNLCDPKDPASAATVDSQFAARSRYADDLTSPPPARGVTLSGATICSGYRAKANDPHYRLLRIATSTTSEFKIVKL